LETKLQEVSAARQKLEVDLKIQTDLVASNAKEMERFSVESKERAQVIATLEAKNDNLNREKGSLEVKIATLNTEIDETNKKLESSEGDRGFLEGELLRLQEEKATLVKQMNDIEFLTAQVKRIKNDIAVARRMDWMRRGVGIYAKRKTVGQLHAMARKKETVGGSNVAGVKGNENVAVELTSDGRVIINGKVIEPEVTTVPEKAGAPVTGQPKK
jgi:chromosome segregation ATPase